MISIDGGPGGPLPGGVKGQSRLPSKRMLLLLRILLLWPVLLGAYLLLAGAASSTELIAGIPTALAASLFAVLLHHLANRQLTLRAPWLRLLARVARSLVSDSVRVGAVLLHSLWRRPPGAVGSQIRQPFRNGDDTPLSAGRRGLVTLGLSLAPNGFVIAMPGGEDAILLHRLVPAPPSDDQIWPA